MSRMRRWRRKKKRNKDKRDKEVVVAVEEKGWQRNI